ncbi:MAG TPA: GTP cyclohydrolase I [Polyangiaceae bacterium]|nr:GTP cyclohydrolase I [Polyangiaceae bacterium]
MIDRDAAREAMTAFLRALGHDPLHHPDLRDTPERVTAAFADELLAGYATDPAALLHAGTCTTQRAAPDDVVTVRGIQVTTICPHHLLPAFGTATVSYLPGAACLGLGVIAHLVDACARRLILQEVLARTVVDALMVHAGARGAYCRVELLHTCLSCRGAREPNARVTVTARAGALAGHGPDPEARPDP